MPRSNSARSNGGANRQDLCGSQPRAAADHGSAGLLVRTWRALVALVGAVLAPPPFAAVARIALEGGVPRVSPRKSPRPLCLCGFPALEEFPGARDKKASAAPGCGT